MSNGKNRAVLAIDPGISGAVAYVQRDDRGRPVKVCIQDIITREHGGMPLVDCERMSDQIQGMPIPDLVLFEEPLAVYSQRGRLTTGARTLKVSLINYGRLQIVIEKLFGVYHWHTVSPSVWKKAMGLSSDKSLSLTLARLNYGLASDLLKRKKDHDRAESLLLAEYAYWHL